MPTLMHGSKSWVWQKKNVSRINAVQMRSLRSVCVECLGKIGVETVMLESGVVLKEDVNGETESWRSTNETNMSPCNACERDECMPRSENKPIIGRAGAPRAALQEKQKRLLIRTPPTLSENSLKRTSAPCPVRTALNRYLHTSGESKTKWRESLSDVSPSPRGRQVRPPGSRPPRRRIYGAILDWDKMTRGSDNLGNRHHVTRSLRPVRLYFNYHIGESV
ncbi:hypothetical protein EVAR_100753_1 [Eumeta japonica]|uniref:Uncharacterized protein n=1 Tax=Eumeta variegata TaxID=151549 RepID=A0A4C1Z7B6_EUMVA|nr:hypothetical protein EVAR_100753_1 [Eumeta japonica]